MYDSFDFFKNIATRKSKIIESIFGSNNLTNYILVTIHRAENTDDSKRLGQIIDILNEIAKRQQLFSLYILEQNQE